MSARGIAAILCAGLILCACADSERGNMRHLKPRLAADAPLPEARELPRSVNSLGMSFVRIPAGSFAMGCEAEQGGLADETPVREVRLDRAFWLGAHEVTQAQWRRVMGDDPASFRPGGRWNEPNVYNYRGVLGFDADNAPVETVSWEEAQEFVRRLNRLEGVRTYRLPTEAEWEYAARCGSARRTFAVDVRRWPTESSILFFSGRGGITFPVGSLPPNPWGLYDMEGNVREWCADRYAPYAGAPEPGPELRVNRGGSWLDPQESHWTRRHANLPGTKSKLIGLRLARDTE